MWLLPPGKLTRQVNASSSNFAAKLESTTSMARLALERSGLYVCLFHFLQIRISILQTILADLNYVKLKPYLLVGVFLHLNLCSGHREL